MLVAFANVVSLMGATVAVGAPPSKRPPPDAIKNAEEAKRVAIELGKKGDREAALPYFRRAYELAPESFDSAANLGKTLLQLEQYREAAGYLSLAKQRFPVGMRDQLPRLERSLKEATRRVVTVNLEVDARFGLIFVDGSEVLELSEKRDNPIFLDPGTHVVFFQGPDGKSAEEVVFEGRAGEVRTLVVPTAPKPPPPAIAGPEDKPPTKRRKKRRSVLSRFSPWTWVAVGSGAATLGTGTALVLVGLEHRGDIDLADENRETIDRLAVDRPVGSGCTPPVQRDLVFRCRGLGEQVDEIEDQQPLVDGLIGTTVILGAFTAFATTYAIVWEDDDDDDDANAGGRGAFDPGVTFFPVVTPTFRGLSLGGTF
ncbi:MAG: tetratricopeptide repeat protein [Myxococcota bacterium]